MLLVQQKLHPKEMVQIIEDADASAIFVSPKLADGLREALMSGLEGRATVEIASPAYEELLSTFAAIPPTSAHESLASRSTDKERLR